MSESTLAAYSTVKPPYGLIHVQSTVRWYCRQTACWPRTIISLKMRTNWSCWCDTLTFPIWQHHVRCHTYCWDATLCNTECKCSTYSLGKISQREVPTQVDGKVKLKERERFQIRKSGERTSILTDRKIPICDFWADIRKKEVATLLLVFLWVFGFLALPD